MHFISLPYINFSYASGRIVELFPAVPINPHWGIVSKCLTYSKAACDPFVYSLLRHQYKKTCADIINRLLKRSSLNASGPRQENQGNSIPAAEWLGEREAAKWRDTVWGLTRQLPVTCEADLLSMKKRGSKIGRSCPCLNLAWHALHKVTTNKGKSSCSNSTVHTERPERQISAVNLFRTMSSWRDRYHSVMILAFSPRWIQLVDYLFLTL